MTERKTYRATARREGSWWVLHVPDIDSTTQARRLDRAEDMVRDLVYAITDEDPGTFDVAIHPDLPESLTELLANAARASSQARIEQLQASIANREAADALVRSGLTVRDAGRLLGMSHQRVQQLLAHEAQSTALRERLKGELRMAADRKAEAFALGRAD